MSERGSRNPATRKAQTGHPDEASPAPKPKAVFLPRCEETPAKGTCFVNQLADELNYLNYVVASVTVTCKPHIALSVCPLLRLPGCCYH